LLLCVSPFLALFRHRAHSNPRLLSGEKRMLIFVLLTHPHFVRVSALRATTGLSTKTFFVETIISQPTTACAVMAEDITLPTGKMIRAYNGSVSSDQKSLCVPKTLSELMT
jgi:hypothetical protein